MELIKNFGVEPVLLIAQIINFLIILYVLKRFAYKPVLTLLKKREETIRMGLKQAEEARILLEKAGEKEAEILKKAQAEAKKLQQETLKKSEELAKRLEEESRKRADLILKEAKEQIGQEAKKAEKNLQVYTTNLAMLFLKKAASNLFSERDQKTVLKDVLKKMKGKNN